MVVAAFWGAVFAGWKEDEVAVLSAGVCFQRHGLSLSRGIVIWLFSRCLCLIMNVI